MAAVQNFEVLLDRFHIEGMHT